MKDQIKQYEVRRAANTLDDGSRLYCWWKRYQAQISKSKTMTDADIRKDAARIAKAQADLGYEAD